MESRNAVGDIIGTDAERSVTALIDRWQTDHDGDALAALVALIRLPLARVVAHTLRRQGVRDPGACEDAWALVIEHLSRLGSADGLRRVEAFDARRTSRGGAVDPGWIYVRCVARSRARDIARDRRRRDRHVEMLVSRRAESPPSVDAEESRGAAVERLRAAVARLDSQSRRVVTLLLDGKSQTVIAHVLGVCEGTVSRIRSRAIAKLRSLLAE